MENNQVGEPSRNGGNAPQNGSASNSHKSSSAARNAGPSTDTGGGDFVGGTCMTWEEAAQYGARYRPGMTRAEFVAAVEAETDAGED